MYNLAMRLIQTHEKSDFDAVASQLGAKKLYPEATALLSHQVNRNVRQFLNLYGDGLPFVRPEDWRRQKVESVILVDSQALSNVRGMVRQPAVHVIDHHAVHAEKAGWTYEVEPVGATVTLLAEKLRSTGHVLTSLEATLLLLGVYEDTGALTYDTTTVRDVQAAAWLLEQGAQLDVVRRYLNIALSAAQQALYDDLVSGLEWLNEGERTVAIATAVAPSGFDDEISSVAHRLREALAPDGLFVLVQVGDGVQLVARSASDGMDVGEVARRFGGGGHSRAAAAMVNETTVAALHDRLVTILPDVIVPSRKVASLMSVGVETVAASLPISEVSSHMLRHGHEGYPVIDDTGTRLVGLVTRRSVDRAMSHEMGDRPVASIMRAGVVSVRPSDPIQRVQVLMAAEGWGQVPVIADDAPQIDSLPIGIVTRTDLLKALYIPPGETQEANARALLQRSLPEPLWALVTAISETAGAAGMPVYLVGGIVRDLMLNKPSVDLDIVVEGDAIALVKQLQARYGGAVHTHERFGTAKWTLSSEVWAAVAESADGIRIDINEGRLSSIPQLVDFATARKEFYKRPTVLPDVERGSIKLDLHRRDFTINTLAIRLDGAHLGQLLDFYGGQRDLQRRLIRVLHSLSFVDDPTRILRAIRLEQRLEFDLEKGTADLIAGALPLLSRVSGDRIRHEIEQALDETDPVAALGRLEALHVLESIHPDLHFTEEAAARFAEVEKLSDDPVWQDTLLAGPPTYYYFALWLADLSPALQESAANRLHARKSTVDDLLAVAALRQRLEALPSDAPPSVVSRLLRPYSVRAWLTIRLLNVSPQVNAWLDQQMAVWRHVAPSTTGHELRAAGLKPGPAYGRILDALLDGLLDGDLVDAAAEKARLAELIDEELTRQAAAS